MSIDGVSGRTSFIGSGIVNLRNQLDTLSEQLSSGRISNTYAGDGTGRSLAIGIRSQLSNYDSYADTATNVNTRIDVANLSLQRLNAIGSEVKGAAVSAGSTLDNTGQTAGQKTASLDFFDSVDMLNAQSGDRYLFSGRATDTAPVAAADQIMNGNGAAIAGLKQVIAERKAADLGATGLGRVILTQPTPTSVQVGEDFAANPAATPPVPASPFGLKLSGISTTIAGATVTQPTATPPATTPPSPLAMSIDLAAATPQNGDTVKFTFNLPDGTSEDINLTASTATPLPANSFAIGATPAATAANLNTALTTATQALANGPLVAASAEQAGNDFFDQPPLRVGGIVSFADNNNIGLQVNNKNAVAVTGNTLLSGAAATNSIGTDFSAGNTITVNGQLLTFTAPGGTNDGTHIPVDSNITALLGKIDALSGNVGAGTTPSAVVNGSVVLHTGTANDLTITTTTPNPNPAFASLGLTSPVNVVRVGTPSYLDNSSSGLQVNNKNAVAVTGNTLLSGAAATDSIGTNFAIGDTITVNGQSITFTAASTALPPGANDPNNIPLDSSITALLGKIDVLSGNVGPGTTPSTVTNGSVVLHTGTANNLAITSTSAGFASLGLTTPVNVARNGGATAQVVGTAANTVIWYQGETGTDSARGTAVAQIDQGITVQYGARADEQALRVQLQNVAVFAAVTTSATDPNANAQISALNQRVANNLATIPGTQTIQDIQADFAGAQASIQSATDRQNQSKVISQTMLDSIEGVNNDEVATKILALQTALQASYQTTAQLYQMSLVKYLPPA
jgi:flagellar hook-associated protein 3 FlgL